MDSPSSRQAPEEPRVKTIEKRLENDNCSVILEINGEMGVVNIISDDLSLYEMLGAYHVQLNDKEAEKYFNQINSKADFFRISTELAERAMRGDEE